jgi:uroporphyrinogen III methyltransferase/synthase
MTTPSHAGSVFLVGAGPGDPSLLTLRAKELLETADVILYDKVMSHAILSHANPNAKQIFVGKQASQHALPQDEINALLVKYAQDGQRVVRLKGGDPLVFGRGGEEASALKEHNIPFQFVPGVSSAIAVPEYAGIPVTDRRFAQSFAVITGHSAQNDSQSPWSQAAFGADTLVFLMGHENLENIANALIKNGRSPDTPAAIIEKGCSPAQRVVEGTLKNIAALAREHNTQTPAIIVVGNVVLLRKSLAWREKLPLAGKRILVTRPQHQAAEILALLRDAGAEAISKPLISMRPLPASENLCQILKEADWIVFTSANGLPFLLDQLRSQKRDVRALGKAKTAAIGPASARCLKNHGLNVDFVPSTFIGDSLAAELPDVFGKNIVIARAKESREILSKTLLERGAFPTVVPVYETQIENISLEDEDAISLVVLTSPSTVQALVKNSAQKPKQQIPVACIGPITANAAREAGFSVVAEASEYTVPGLVRAICEYFQKDSL